VRIVGATFSICVRASIGTGTDRLINVSAGVNGVRGSTCDGRAGAVSRCAGRPARAWYRLMGRFTSISNKRHHSERRALDEGWCAARREVRDGFMLTPDCSCRAFRQRFERLWMREDEAVGVR
jgi:hypothetical protein